MAGQPVHVEIPAADPAGALGFWGGLFGWQFQEYPGSPSGYHMTQLSEQTGAAIYRADAGERGLRVYFDVDDIGAGIARVRELGGTAGEALPVPSMGWFAHCQDPGGNEFGLWQTDPSAPAPEA
ncbi:MAG TPA: VOC family protein [Gaiellaceae bacterium]|nr:VOC family protein [Gaiellaceae bacterium]